MDDHGISNSKPAAPGGMVELALGSDCQYATTLSFREQRARGWFIPKAICASRDDWLVPGFAASARCGLLSEGKEGVEKFANDRRHAFPPWTRACRCFGPFLRSVKRADMQS